MTRIPEDPTIHVGLRLYDGTDNDTTIERVEYGGFGVIAFGPNVLRNGETIVYKTLRRELLDEPQTRASFVRECLLWVGLWGHANVAVAHAVLEMGDTQGLRPFLALEYAEHGSLREFLRKIAQNTGEGRLPLELGLYFAQQIAAGLAYLHQPEPAYLRYEPTVHRDLKPENVLIMGNGRAVITDFGLAKAVEASPAALALLLANSGRYEHGSESGYQAEEAIIVGGDDVTRSMGIHTARGVTLGTVPYMAPEQWDDARYAGTPADIYALGIMLSEILTGRHALLDLRQTHSQADWRRAHSTPQPRPLREIASDVPAIVEAIYQRCLASDPEERPTADEVLAALQQGASAAGVEVYIPGEIAPHTPRNEFAHWHVWSIAHRYFRLYDEALERSDRALAVARHLNEERPDSLPSALMTRGNILKALGAQAMRDGNEAEAATWDRQAEVAYQDSLITRPPFSTPDGRRGRSYVWHQIGAFNNERKRYAYAEDAFARALTLQPDMADTYYSRAINQAQWGQTEWNAGQRESGIAHLRQARVLVVTAVAMKYPPAARLLHDIEEALRSYGVTD
jgi:serine/threonine protein kinase